LIEQVSFTLQGPEGWNKGAPFAWQIKVRSYSISWGHMPLRALEAVPGAYTLKAVVNQREEGTATFRIDLDGALPRPTFLVRSGGGGYVIEYGAACNFAGCAALYEVLVERLGTSQANHHVESRAPGRAQAGGLPSGRYRAIVSAYNWDFGIAGPPPRTGDAAFSRGFHGSEAVPQEFVLP
jgi:hypothetical protein